MFRGVTKCATNGTSPAPPAGVGRRGALVRPRAARGGSPRSGTAQHGSGGAVGAPMRRRTGRSLPDPCPAAPNRSGDGDPTPVHGRPRSLGWPSLPRRTAGAVEQLRLPAIAVAQPFLHPAAGPGGRLALGEQARELAPVLDLLEQ